LEIKTPSNSGRRFYVWRIGHELLRRASYRAALCAEPLIRSNDSYFALAGERTTESRPSFEARATARAPQDDGLAWWVSGVPSLRAKRSNPFFLCALAMDCFVANAPRNDG
jgi:hypothetical protein